MAGCIEELVKTLPKNRMRESDISKRGARTDPNGFILVFHRIARPWCGRDPALHADPIEEPRAHFDYRSRSSGSSSSSSRCRSDSAGDRYPHWCLEVYLSKLFAGAA